MNARLEAATAAIDADIAAAKRMLPPPRLVESAPPTFPPLEETPEDQEEFDNHRNAPRPDPKCLYGLVGEIARAGSATTEANPFAIAASAIAYIGCAVGRGPYMPVGNTWHHARFFMLHVGRSGEGRKGDAVSLIKRIARRVEEMSEHHAPQVHTGGLSSREGLAYLIHDGYKEGKEDVPPVEDKRLLVIESEFVNVLAQCKRDGNTLSAALRDCWDGVSLKPATKTNRLWASNPHVCLLGAITGSELMACMSSRDMTNGFANRFLPYWAERTGLIPFPKATPAAEVDRLAGKVLDVLKFCEAERWVDRDHLRMELSTDASTRWAQLYKGELNDRSHGERINTLVERRAPMLLRLAMLFALTDCTNVVGVRHIEAALAWIRYSLDSVKFIFGSAKDEAKVVEINTAAQKIMEFITARRRVTRTQITRECFGSHKSKNEIDAALDELLTSNPPKIEVEEERVQAGRPIKHYSIFHANYATKATNQAQQGFAQDFAGCDLSDISDISTGDMSQCRSTATKQNELETRMNADKSLMSHMSHDEFGNEQSNRVNPDSDGVHKQEFL